MKFYSAEEVITMLEGLPSIKVSVPAAEKLGSPIDYDVVPYSEVMALVGNLKFGGSVEPIKHECKCKNKGCCK